MQRLRQIGDLLEQSFNTFNRYGKDDSQLGDMTELFYEILKPYSLDEITNAFREWARVGKAIPVPADIREIINDLRPKISHTPKYLQGHEPVKLLTDEQSKERVAKGFEELKAKLKGQNRMESTC